MPVVSVIMPCHNGANYILNAIASVQNQTFVDWELLVIDDQSSDDSVQIVENEATKDSRIKLFKTSCSTGMPATPRNIGIKEARGQFIAFLDCDDEWLPNKLEKQLPLFKNEECAIVFSYYEKMNVDGSKYNSIITSPKHVTFRQLLNGDCIGNLTGVYDSLKVGKIFQKEIHAEDYLMWLEILKKGYIAINTNTLEAKYRVSSSSTSGNKFKSAMWNWYIYRHELSLSLPESIYHFTMYLIKGIIKYIK